jgi:hypothetical protein
VGVAQPWSSSRAASDTRVIQIDEKWRIENHSWKVASKFISELAIPPSIQFFILPVLGAGGGGRSSQL